MQQGVPGMKTAVKKPSEAVRLRKEWQALVEQLADQVETWATERGWAVHRDVKQIKESGLGTYTVPFVSIHPPSGRVHLDPIARNVCGGSGGRVDLTAWPTSNRMLLLRAGNRWRIRDDYGVAWREKWSPETFERMVEAVNALD